MLIRFIVIILILLPSIKSYALNKINIYDSYQKAKYASSPQQCLGILSELKYARAELESHYKYCDIIFIKANCLSGDNRIDEAILLLDSIYKVDLSTARNATGKCSIHYETPRLKRNLLELNGNYADALIVQNIIIDDVYNEKYPELYYLELANKAEILIKYKKLDQALEIYNHLIDTHKNDSLQYIQYSILKAKFYNNIQKHSEAITIVDELIKSSGELYLYLTKANILTNAGQYNQALDVYNQAINIEPEFLFAYVHKAKLLTNDHFKNYKEALSLSNKIINDFPDYKQPVFNAYLIKGFCLMKIKKYEQALAAFDKMRHLKKIHKDIEVDIDYYRAYIFEAISLAELEKYSDALNNLESVKNIPELAEESEEARVKIINIQNSLWHKIKKFIEKII